jgi:hypothetical protein
MSERQSELQSLHETFKIREKEAISQPFIPEDAYLCVRLDGIHHSKQFLKNHLEYPAYNYALKKSIQDVHGFMRTVFDRRYPENLVCACSFTDEVSFIFLNTIKNEKYAQRSMKVCTTLSGNLSAAMTLDVAKHESTQVSGLLAFDARPIYLNDVNDIVSYVRHRYLLASGQAFWKVLRLRDYPGWETGEIRANYDHARALVEENGWAEEAEKIRNSFRIYLPQFDLEATTKKHDIPTWNQRIYKLIEINPTDTYCTDRKLGEDIAELFDELRVPYSFTNIILG